MTLFQVCNLNCLSKRHALRNCMQDLIYSSVSMEIKPCTQGLYPKLLYPNRDLPVMSRVNGIVLDPH